MQTDITKRTTYIKNRFVSQKTTRLRALLIAIALAGLSAAQSLPASPLSLPTQDGGVVSADVYGHGTHGVVLAHGGPFTKESWKLQAQALQRAGFYVVAIDFRGRGLSHGGPDIAPGDDGFHFDVLAAIRYLRSHGAKTISLVGASFGGDAAAQAAIEAGPREVDRLVMLAAWTAHPEKLQCRKLFIVARDDANSDGPRLPNIQANFDQASQPKELIVVDGSAHAQYLFSTPQGDRVMREILRFLTAR